MMINPPAPPEGPKPTKAEFTRLFHHTAPHPPAPPAAPPLPPSPPPSNHSMIAAASTQDSNKYSFLMPECL